MNNKQKTLLNFMVSILSQVIILTLGLIVPRIIIRNYGSDTNGLTSTIEQIFTYLALLEAGISSAARNALYKPIKDNNRSEISRWVSSARKYYRKISYIYFAAIIVLSFIMPIVFQTNVGYWTVFVYILFEGLSSVLSFYFINTWICLLTANGNNYVISSITLLTKVLCYCVKIPLALLGINIAFIQIGYLGVSLIQLLIYKIYMTKRFGWIEYCKYVDCPDLPDKSSYVVSEICWTVFSSTDMIILSAFVSTALSSVYSVYNIVFVSLNSMLNAVYSGINYNLGHTYVKTPDNYSKVHDLYNSAFVGIVTIFMSVAYVLIIPFVKLYTSGIEDTNYIYSALPICFCLIQILSWSRYIGGNLIGIAGRQKKAVKVNVAEAMINLALSIILVKAYGIVGVTLATVCALPLKVVYCNYISDIKIMKRAPWKTLKILGSNYLIFGVVILINNFISLNIQNYFSLVIYGVLLLLIIGIPALILNCIVNKDLFSLILSFLTFGRRDKTKYSHLGE